MKEYERVQPLILEELRNVDRLNFTLTMVNMGPDENENEPTIHIGVNDMKRVPEILSETYIPIHVYETRMWGAFERFND